MKRAQFSNLKHKTHIHFDITFLTTKASKNQPRHQNRGKGAKFTCCDAVNRGASITGLCSNTNNKIKQVQIRKSQQKDKEKSLRARCSGFPKKKTPPLRFSKASIYRETSLVFEIEGDFEFEIESNMLVQIWTLCFWMDLVLHVIEKHKSQKWNGKSVHSWNGKSVHSWWSLELFSENRTNRKK